MHLYCIHNLAVLVFLALLNAAFFLRIDWDMDLLSHGRLRRLVGRNFFGMHCSLYAMCLEDDVLKLLLAVDTVKASGPEGVYSWMLKLKLLLTQLLPA